LTKVKSCSFESGRWIQARGKGLRDDKDLFYTDTQDFHANTRASFTISLFYHLALSHLPPCFSVIGELLAVDLFKFLLRNLRGRVEVGFGEHGLVNVLGVLDAVRVVNGALGNLVDLAKL